ncbi:serine hydrolase [Agromyces sp. Soil535]|uniref:serine hydrolase domain-containing protein n=1 Tax=Agromyces sp. Soil535 TaxID=1736390 RepID=UPI0006F76CA2|nr:serine hydrolase domain-containing protein [Agromyces sp. Soil535]KRE31252.1 hypothetical protein ASG80_02010 [Agromyces sp. Soil535]
MATPRVACPRILSTAATIATAVALAMAGCYFSGPVDRAVTGDEELLEFARQHYTEAWHRVAVAVIDGDDVRTGFVTADSSTMFELGIASRVLTGELLARGIELGEVSLDDPIGAHLALGDSPVASITLRQLATHHSGLPEHPMDPEFRDPDMLGVEGMLEIAAGVIPQQSPGYHLGGDLDAALVGQVLATAAGVGYADLLEERVLEPAAMEDAVVMEATDLLPAALAQGHDRLGVQMPSRGHGPYAPATGVAVTMDDMIALAKAVIAGPVSESKALEPISDTIWPETRIGYFWEIEDRPEGELAYVVGWSPGFSCALLVDRRDDEAAILLSNVHDTWPWGPATELLEIVED